MLFTASGVQTMALPTPLADPMQARSSTLSEYKHDNPAAAHRVCFIDISDLEEKPKPRIIVGYGGSKDHNRTNQQTDGIRKAMIAVSILASIEGSQAGAFDPSMFLRQLDSDDPSC